MHRLKLVLLALGGFVMMALVILVIFVVSLEDDDYRRIFITKAEQSLGCRIYIDGDFQVDLSATPSISMSAVRLEQLPARPQPPVSYIGKLRVQGSVAGLLRGLVVIKELIIEDASATVVVDDNIDAGRIKGRNRSASGKNILPIFERVVIRNSMFRFQTGAGAPVVVHFQELKLDDVRDNGPVFFACDGAVNDKPFSVEGQLGSIANLLDHGHVPYPIDVDLVFKATGVQFHSTGTVADPVEGRGIDIRITGHVENLADSLKVLNVDTPPLGEMVFDATISGDFNKPAVSKIRLTISGEPDVRLEVGGSVGNILTGEATALDVVGFCAIPELLALIPVDGLPDEAKLSVKGTVADRQGRFVYNGTGVYDSNDEMIHATAEGRLVLGGQLNRPQVVEMDLAIKTATRETAALRPFLFDALPEFGSVAGSSRLAGTPEQFRFEEIEVRAVNSEKLTTLLSGDTKHQKLGNGTYHNTIDLWIQIDAPRMGAVESLLGERYLTDLGPVMAKGRLKSSGEALALEDIRLELGRSDTVHLTWNASIDKIPLTDGETISGVGGMATIRAKNVASFNNLFNLSLPEVGAFRASFRTVDHNGKIGARDVSITAGDAGNLQLTATGHVDTIADTKGRVVDGIHLQTRVQAPDTGAVANVLKTELPELGAIDGTFLLRGGDGSLSITDMEISSTTASGLDIQTVGGIERIGLGDNGTIAGIDITARATAADTAIVANILGWKLPELGPFTMNANFTGWGNDINLEIFDIRTGDSKRPSLQLQGKAKHLTGSKPIAVKAAFEIEPGPWLSDMAETFESDFDRLSGEATFTLEGTTVAIEKLQASGIAGDAVSLTASGTIVNPGDDYSLDLQLTSRMDVALISEKLYGKPYYRGAPLDIQGRLEGLPGKVDFSGEIRVKDTRFDTLAGYAVGAKHPRFSVNLQSSSIHLPDLGFFGKNNQRSIMETDAKKNRRAGGRLFTDRLLPIFNTLKNVDASIELKAGELIGSEFVTNELEITVLAEDGNLRIHPARVTYADGVIETDVNIRNEGDEPQIAFTLTGEDVDMAKLFSHVQQPLISEGILNLGIDLKSKGRTSRKLAESLNGEVAFSVESGKIRGSVDMLSTDAIDLLTTLPGVVTYSRMNCAAIRFVFQDGIGASQAIYLNTNTVHSEGKGVVNLVDETVDIVIQPESKRGSITGNSPVRINGSLSSPRIRKIPGREAVQLAGDILLPYVFLPARGLGLLRYLITKDKDEKDPCFLLLQETEP